MRRSAYCTAEQYDLLELRNELNQQGYYPLLYDDVLFIQLKEEDITQEIFFFPYGCVSFWGLSEDGEKYFLALLKNYEKQPHEGLGKELGTYAYGPETTIDEETDLISLESQDVLIKLSMAHGLSQSAKLEVFEKEISQTIEATRHLPAEMKEKGKIPLSRKSISQHIGALFAQRNSINLHSDILDQPEFFWRRPRYEPYYLMASQYMDITTRLDILNRKLDVIHELYTILSDELKHLHSSRLELTVIGLIMMEVVLASMGLVAKLLG
jgi:uncharacterized Rmd1/YagE family protein